MGKREGEVGEQLGLYVILHWDGIFQDLGFVIYELRAMKGKMLRSGSRGAYKLTLGLNQPTNGFADQVDLMLEPTFGSNSSKSFS